MLWIHWLQECSRGCQRWLITLGLVTCLGWLPLPSAAIAQPYELPLPSVLLTEANLSPLSPDPASISIEKINQFVQAYLQVVELIERREGELQAAESESESQKIERDIEAEALRMIESQNLTRQEYLQLLGLANTDPEFGERIAAQLQESG